ncbi:hypothetical protein [Crocosphaera sp.]|uniref:hypothetical protein n=1 Tax=Crocosphaera sp. TaxID=2729996 RepID=UPI003F2351B9
MWQRETFHDCANELECVSRSFRDAYTNNLDTDQQNKNKILMESSTKGIEILRILSLAIRSEQDYDEAFRNNTSSMSVGFLKNSVTDNDLNNILDNYQPSYCKRDDFKPLNLREALNKIAHVNPYKTSFFADNSVHDLILTGNKNHQNWIAVISIVNLCNVIKSLPDRTVKS